MKTIISIITSFQILLGAFIFNPRSVNADPPVSYEVLFVGFDTGETNIFAEVMKNWESKQKVGILTMATSTKVAKDLQLNNQIDLNDFSISCPSDQRLFQLSDSDLTTIKSQLKAHLIFTGLYSTPQRQIAESYKKDGSLVIGCWDNFSTLDRLPSDLVQNVEGFAKFADFILTPSQEVADDLNKRFNMDKAIAIGQPTLDVWEKKIKEIDLKPAFAKTPFDEKKPVVVFMGGYEEKGNNYNDAFTLLANSLKDQGDQLQLLIQLHPRSDGQFEKNLLEELSKNGNYPIFMISDSKKNLSAFEAVAISRLVVSHRSTASIQALFAGKNILHVDVKTSPYTNFAIEKGLAQKLSDPKEIQQAIVSTIKQAPLQEDSLLAYYDQGGIPPHGTQRMIAFIEKKISAE